MSVVSTAVEMQEAPTATAATGGPAATAATPVPRPRRMRTGRRQDKPVERSRVQGGEWPIECTWRSAEVADQEAAAVAVGGASSWPVDLRPI
mmetsp:Transcript_25824/g.85954  ORF Transcript_25824/g.85954 Transcript_25824/m.85954 type:complete len:92 (+) Transcript_25824:2022-2297(+)